MNQMATGGIGRRAWLAGCARAAVLGGIAAAAGVLASRGQFCGGLDEGRGCAACGRLWRCDLPAAAAVRAQHTRQGDR